MHQQLFLQKIIQYQIIHHNIISELYQSLFLQYMSQFGKQRLADFYLDPTYINTNHGSYGSAPKSVIDIKRKYQQIMEFNTEKWFRKNAEVQIKSIRNYLATKLQCNLKNIFLVQNSTDAINSFMKSLHWQEGDVILLANTTYKCVYNTLLFIKERFKVNFLEVNFTADDFQSPESILLKIQNTVNGYDKKIKLAVFDHIISVPSVVCPIEQIREFLSQKSIPLIVDGAHAICQLPINLSLLNVDVYFSNFHKWGFSSKNAAFIYISDRYLDQVTPAITGNFYYQGIDRQFFWTGTRDLSSFMTIRPGIEYCESFGKDAVYNYNHNLVMAAGKRMAQIWKTKVLTNDSRCVGFINNVEVPSNDIKLCEEISLQLLDNYNCFPLIVQFKGKLYCRISSQIFNELSDYEFTANKFLEALKAKNKQMIQQ